MSLQFHTYALGLGPKMYYRCNDAGTSTIADHSGNGKDLTASGIASGSFGRLNRVNNDQDGGSIGFDGVNDYAYSSDSAFNLGTKASIFVFGRFPSQAALYAVLVSKDSTVSGERGFNFGIASDSTEKWGVAISDDGLTNQKYYESSVDPQDGIDRMFGWTFDGTSDTLKLYDQGAETTPTKILDSACTGIYANSKQFRIGAFDSGVVPNYATMTDLAVVLVFDKVLTGTEIANLWTYFNDPEEGPVDPFIERAIALGADAVYGLDQLGRGTAWDSTANANHGFYSIQALDGLGTAPLTTAGYSVDFNGSNMCVQIPYQAGIHGGTVNKLTVLALTKATDTSIPMVVASHLYGSGVTSILEGGWLLATNSGKVQAAVLGTANGSTIKNKVSNRVINDGAKHLIGFVFDGSVSGGNLRLIEDMATAPSVYVDADGSMTSVYVGTHDPLIGCNLESDDSSSNLFDGVIDNVLLFYGLALTDSEIRYIAESGVYFRNRLFGQRRVARLLSRG